MSRSASLIGAPLGACLGKVVAGFPKRTCDDCKNLTDPELAFSIEIEWSPEHAVDDHDEEAHHRYTEHDAMKIAGFGLLGNIGAEPIGLQMLVAPGRDLGNDAR